MLSEKYDIKQYDFCRLFCSILNVTKQFVYVKIRGQLFLERGYKFCMYLNRVFKFGVRP